MIAKHPSLLAALLAAACLQPPRSHAAMPVIELRPTNDVVVDKPASPQLYSNFIEVGYGIQVEPMWAEMLWNRSLEPFTPYRQISHQWWDLWLDPKDPSKGLETDWRKFDWWHSGYEHNAWFAAPAPLPGLLPIDDDSTFLVMESTEAAVHLQPMDGGAPHGARAMRVVNNGDGWGGLAQDGKVVRGGQELRFSGLLRGDGPAPVATRVALLSEEDCAAGKWDAPVAEATLEAAGPEFARREALLRVPDGFSGRAVLALLVEPRAAVAVDALSLMPTETIGGWRPEVVEAARRVNPAVMRFPGGCFASFHDWRESIGPRDERTPRPSFFWGGLNMNDVGVAEMADFCRAIGAEMMYCVNVHHPLKEKWDWHLSEENRGPHGWSFPQFTDIEQGAREAAALVAYCNAGVDHPMGALRASHGWPEPFAIKYWELDNETHRWFKPLEYAEACVVYARAMKAVDPTIEVGMITYSGEFEAELEQMLEVAGADIDFMADRSYGQGWLDFKLGHLRRHNEKHGRALFYANTEWLAYEGAPDAYNMLRLEGEATRSFLFSKWRYALNVARNFLMFERAGGDLRFVNFNNFANTHAQCVLESPKEGVYLPGAGRVLELMSRTGAAWPVRIEGHDFNVDERLVISGAWTMERDAFVLQIVNMDDEAREARVDLSGLGRDFASARLSMLSAESGLAMNTLSDPDGIRREERELGMAPGEALAVELPAWSLVVVRVE